MSRGRKSLAMALLSLCLCLVLLCLVPAQACAAGAGVIDRVLCSLNYEPVVMMELQYVNVSTSSAHATITSAWWTDASGVAVSGQFGKGNYTLNVNYSANPGYVFGQGIPGYINNKGDGVTVTVSADGSAATLQKTYQAMIWTPTSIKDPTSATVEFGGWTSFAASSMYAESHEWILVPPEGAPNYDVSSTGGVLPGLTWSGEDTERLVLHNIPAELNGWKVICRHWSVDHVNYADSRPATITVTNIPTPEPTANITPVPLTVPTETPAPTPEMPASPEEEAGSSVVQEPVVTAVPDAHTHSYSWHSDADSHWWTCAGCDEVGQKESHLYVWHETYAATPERDGEETGVCSVCGYSITRPLPYEGSGTRSALGLGEKLGIDGLSDVQILLIGGAAACLLLLILSAALSPRRRRRR